LLRRYAHRNDVVLLSLRDFMASHISIFNFQFSIVEVATLIAKGKRRKGTQGRPVCKRSTTYGSVDGNMDDRAKLTTNVIGSVAKQSRKTSCHCQYSGLLRRYAHRNDVFLLSLRDFVASHISFSILNFQLLKSLRSSLGQ
jgi:hypothetical protein